VVVAGAGTYLKKWPRSTFFLYNLYSEALPWTYPSCCDVFYLSMGVRLSKMFTVLKVSPSIENSRSVSPPFRVF